MTIKELSIAEDIANLIGFLHELGAEEIHFDKGAGLRFALKSDMLKETQLMPAENNTFNVLDDWAFDLKMMIEDCTIQGLELRVDSPLEGQIYSEWEEKARAIGDLPIDELMVEGMKIIPIAANYEGIRFVISIRNAQ